MAELTRYLTLVGLLFGIGLYGLLTRRSLSAIIISLGVMAGSVTLALVVFNHAIRPSDASGYLFAIILTVLAGLYATVLYPLLTSKRDTNRADTETEVATNKQNNAPPLSLRNIIVDMGSFSSQISLAILFILSYLLARVSPEALVAFLLGVVALKYILLKRMRDNRHDRHNQHTANTQDTVASESFHESSAETDTNTLRVEVHSNESAH